jgi:hypothetical protein
MPLVRPRPFAAASLALLGLLAGATAARAQDYEIKLVRPPAVGQKYTMTAEGAIVRASTLKLDGREARKTDNGYGVRLEGTVEVLAVNADGEEGKATCTVVKCVRTTRDGETELVPAGRVITAEGGKADTTYSLDQGELPDDVKEALRLVFRMGEEDGYNDDKIYGTAQRQPVGGSWPLDPKLASEEAKADEMVFDPADISGSLSIEKVERVGDVECLRIGGTTEIKKFTAKPPTGMTFETGSLKAKYSGLFPVDTKLGVLAETMSVTQSATLRGKTNAGQDAVIESKVQRATEMSRKFL